MKQIKSSGWGLLSLLAALTLMPLSAYARDAEPVVRTKPVVDQPYAQKHAAPRVHDIHHRHAHPHSAAHDTARLHVK